MEKIIDSYSQMDKKNIFNVSAKTAMDKINLGKGKQFPYDKKVACHKVIEKMLS